VVTLDERGLVTDAVAFLDRTLFDAFGLPGSPRAMANPFQDEHREPVEETERGEHNRIGYYNADEEREHDESPGTQGPGPGEPPPEDA
jgi:hypothetical protein